MRNIKNKTKSNHLSNEVQRFLPQRSKKAGGWCCPREKVNESWRVWHSLVLGVQPLGSVVLFSYTDEVIVIPNSEKFYTFIVFILFYIWKTTHQTYHWLSLAYGNTFTFHCLHLCCLDYTICYCNFLTICKKIPQKRIFFLMDSATYQWKSWAFWSRLREDWGMSISWGLLHFGKMKGFWRWVVVLVAQRY